MTDAPQPLTQNETLLAENEALPQRPRPLYHFHQTTLPEALALLANPDFRIKDMRMGTEFDTWAVYWEFITPDYHWYRVTAEDHMDPLALELYRACWNYGQRNAPHLYGLFDKKEEANAG